MKKFKLCFELKGKNEYIAPQRLKADQPEYTWENDKNLQLKYVYEFMPKGIVGRLIVELHDYIKNDLIWNTGGVFERENTIAEVKEVYGKNAITIKVKGTKSEAFRAEIMWELDKINSSFQNLQLIKLVPCNCNSCLNVENPFFFNESELIERKHFGKFEIGCGRPPYLEADVLKMLNDISLEKLQNAKFPSKKYDEEFIIRGKGSQKIGERLAGLIDSVPELNRRVAQEHNKTRELVKNESDKNIEIFLTKFNEIPEIFRQNFSNENEKLLVAQSLKNIEIAELQMNQTQSLISMVKKASEEIFFKIPSEDDIMRAFQEMTKLERGQTNVDLKHKLKVTLPIIPTILKYERELSGDIFKDLKERFSEGGLKAIFIEPDKG